MDKMTVETDILSNEDHYADDLFDRVRMNREEEAERLTRQQFKVLGALRRAGPGGITSWDLLMQTHVIRFSERLRELRRMGYRIPEGVRVGTTEDGDSIFNYHIEED